MMGTRRGSRNHELEPDKVHYYILHTNLRGKPGSDIECIERVRSLVMQERIA